VTKGNQIALPAPIQLVQSAFGIATLSGTCCAGLAVASDAGNRYLGVTNAVNPGQAVSLRGSGIGPVAGDKTIAQKPTNLTNIPVEVGYRRNLRDRHLPRPLDLSRSGPGSGGGPG